MKKALLLVAALLLSTAAAAGPNSIVFTQRNAADTGNVLRTPQQPAVDALVYFNVATNLPAYWTLGPGLSVTNGVLSASGTGPAPVNADWSATSGLAQILNKPAFASVALSGNYGDLSGRPALASVATSGAYADLTGKPALFSGLYADLSGKPVLSTVATSGDYNDLVNKPAPYTFNFGMPVTRTLALSTAYTALNAAKPATVTVSPTCTASLTLSGGGTCTLQARIGTAPLTCSSGTVVATWTNGNTGALSVGLALNQTVGAPYSINLPAGASMVLCPTAGTFTVSAAEQSVG